jgi:hypothetical protein
MRNETFRKISFFVSLGAAILSLINIIISLVRATKEVGNFIDAINDGSFLEYSFGSVLYKIAFILILISVLTMTISFLINTDGILKILMIIIRAVQIGALIVGGVATFSTQIFNMFGIAFMLFAIMEVIAFILYLIDRDHRNTILRVLVFDVWSLGAGIIFMIGMIILLFVLVIKVFSWFTEERKYGKAVVDKDGKIIGWLKDVEL